MQCVYLAHMIIDIKLLNRPRVLYKLLNLQKMKAETTEEEANATNATKDNATDAFAISTYLSAAEALFVQ